MHDRVKTCDDWELPGICDGDRDLIDIDRQVRP